MSIKSILICTFFVSSIFWAKADSPTPKSDTTILTKNFKFEDGIYLSINAFQNNTPDFKWTDLQTSYYLNEKEFTAQFETILHPTTGKEIEVKDIWGATINGIPYLNIKMGRKENDRRTSLFVGLRLRGKYCYYSYQGFVDLPKTFTVFDPETQEPLRSHTVTMEEPALIKKMLDFKTGKTVAFNQQNLLEWIKDDLALTEAVRNLEEEEIEEKLFKCLLIYVDRHPVYIK